MNAVPTIAVTLRISVENKERIDRIRKELNVSQTSILLAGVDHYEQKLGTQTVTAE